MRTAREQELSQMESHGMLAPFYVVFSYSWEKKKSFYLRCYFALFFLIFPQLKNSCWTFLKVVGGKKFGKYKFLSSPFEYNIAALEVIQQFKTKQKLLPKRVKTSRATSVVSYIKLKMW